MTTSNNETSSTSTLSPSSVTELPLGTFKKIGHDDEGGGNSAVNDPFRHFHNTGEMIFTVGLMVVVSIFGIMNFMAFRVD